MLRSEWTKLRSVRSTYWTAARRRARHHRGRRLICRQHAARHHHGKDSLDGFDPTLTSLNGIYLAQIAVGTLGVLVISSEYGTGMIRATITAVPQRRAVLAAKGWSSPPAPS